MPPTAWIKKYIYIYVNERERERERNLVVVELRCVSLCVPSKAVHHTASRCTHTPAKPRKPSPGTNKQMQHQFSQRSIKNSTRAGTCFNASWMWWRKQSIGRFEWRGQWVWKQLARVCRVAPAFAKVGLSALLLLLAAAVAAALLAVSSLDHARLLHAPGSFRDWPSVVRYCCRFFQASMWSSWGGHSCTVCVTKGKALLQWFGFGWLLHNRLS